MKQPQFPNPPSSLRDAMPHGNETILVVEDEDMLRSLCTQILDSLGYRVMTASDGLIAYELVKDYPRRIDLILSDVVLPELKGPTMVSRARELRSDFKVLYTSGHSITSCGDAFDELPEERKAELLAKPYTPEELAREVRKVLDTAGLDQSIKLNGLEAAA